MTDEQRPQPRRNAPADITFSVDVNAIDIPTLGEVPETPEEKRNRWILRGIAVAIVIATAMTSLVVYLYVQHLDEVRTAVHSFDDDGRPETLEAALVVLGDDDDDDGLSLRARLLATATLEHGQDRAAEAQALVAEVDLDDEPPPDALIAATYLALIEGDLEAAAGYSQRVAVGGHFPAEGAHAIAVTALARGDLAAAVEQARIALAQSPNAPRYKVALSTALLRAGARDEALATLEGLGERSDVSVMRARILVTVAGREEDAASAAAEVTSAALPREQRWAATVHALVAERAGQWRQAWTKAEEASAEATPGEEELTLTLAELFAQTESADEARRRLESLQRLPEDLSSRRARASAEVALLDHDLTAAEEALSDAPDSAATALLRGRLLARKGQLTQARPHLQAAKRDGLLAHRATARLADLDLDEAEEDDSERLRSRARAAVEPLLSDTPLHPVIARVAIRARLADGAAEEALAAAQAATEANESNGSLWAAKALAQMALERWEPAYTTWARAVEAGPARAVYHVERARCARELDRDDAAKTAWEAALELEADQADALTGLLTLAVEAGDADRTEQVLARVDEAEVRSATIERLRAWFFVSAGSGAEGIGPVRAALEDLDGDRELLLAAGYLYMQAGAHRDALLAFARILADDDSDAEGLIGRAMAQVHLNTVTLADHNLDKARDGAEALEPARRALYHAARARVLFAQDRMPAAGREARAAIARDPRCSEARLVLAELVERREQDPSRQLRAALEGRAPPPAAMARLVLLSAVSEGDEPAAGPDEATCGLGRRYLSAAPRGEHAAAVRRIVRTSCAE